ncbi:hypothetical protein [Sphingobium subterraneum]|uniref:Uncharacterized protein n=1 Tax=Sphingobium subterraneum TaxID=627688 RepID=A0A841J370_9SPHN|nr:hypothetical protein [Sphingobium subterraneum]MBB6125130.1 hypothetical protein [Sphingobium subterraneum]
MAYYRVEYYSGEIRKGTTPHAGDLEKVKRFAADGLIRHGADRALIVNDDTGATAAVVEK